MGEDDLERLTPDWKTWSVLCGASMGRRTEWSAHPQPELECGTQQELSDAIRAATTGNATLELLTKAAGPSAVPDEPFEGIPRRPSLMLLDQERGKLAALHPVWHVTYGIKQIAREHLEITWRARPEPLIFGAQGTGELGARIDQVMSDAYMKICEGDRSPVQPH